MQGQVHYIGLCWFEKPSSTSLDGQFIQRSIQNVLKLNNKKCFLKIKQDLLLFFLFFLGGVTLHSWLIYAILQIILISSSFLLCNTLLSCHIRIKIVDRQIDRQIYRQIDRQIDRRLVVAHIYIIYMSSNLHNHQVYSELVRHRLNRQQSKLFIDMETYG